MPASIDPDLGSAVLPDELPGLPGRLALDFVPVGSPTGPVSSVFFDGLTVTAVPEPASAALLAAGLLSILGWRLRRRPAGRQPSAGEGRRAIKPLNRPAAAAPRCRPG